MVFREYKESDANEIIKWIDGERALRLWSADRYEGYPITAEAINANYKECKRNNGFYPMTLEVEGKIVGHLILRNPGEDKSIIRLGFIIVDSGLRGKGYGKILIQNAISYAKEKLIAKEINLGVFAVNESAYRCYSSVGFVTISIEKNSFRFNEENWDCVEMVLK